MASSKIPEPVMHVNASDFEGVENLGVKLIAEGLYKNNTDFPTPPVTLIVFTAAVEDLSKLIASAKGNSNNVKLRNEQSAVVHGLIKKNLMYAKPICMGNVDLIVKSGFNSSSTPSAHTVAPQVVIKKIEKGGEPNTIRVVLEPIGGSGKGKKENRSYIVNVYDETGTTLERTGCVSTDSRSLIVHDVPFMKIFSYAVSIKNAAGTNEPSAKMRFILTDI